MSILSGRAGGCGGAVYLYDGVDAPVCFVCVLTVFLDGSRLFFFTRNVFPPRKTNSAAWSDLGSKFDSVQRL